MASRHASWREDMTISASLQAEAKPPLNEWPSLLVQSPMNQRLRALLREWVLPAVVVIGILAPLRSAVADWNDVPSGSMMPTILVGDRIFINKLAYRSEERSIGKEGRC